MNEYPFEIWINVSEIDLFWHSDGKMNILFKSGVIKEITTTNENIKLILEQIHDVHRTKNHSEGIVVK